MKRISMFFLIGLCCFIVLKGREARTQAQQSIANVTIPITGALSSPDEVRALIADDMKALLPEAVKAGATAIHLQSDAYTIVPKDGRFIVSGNLFIDIVPEPKTEAVVSLLQKRGVQAAINRFQQCNR